MNKLFKCTICGYVYEGENAPEKCPKCDFASDKFVELDKETSEKIYRSDKTNVLLMKLATLADEMIKISQAGIEDNLDPTCEKLFTRAKDEAWIIKQRAKAEISGHISKSKW